MACKLIEAARSGWRIVAVPRLGFGVTTARMFGYGVHS
jgi:hypothetical protein